LLIAIIFLNNFLDVKRCFFLVFIFGRNSLVLSSFISFHTFNLNHFVVALAFLLLVSTGSIESYLFLIDLISVLVVRVSNSDLLNGFLSFSFIHKLLVYLLLLGLFSSLSGLSLSSSFFLLLQKKCSSFLLALLFSCLARGLAA